ncbi:hypothetical protein ACHAXT_012035 [Thalassiosira profunda]
MTIQIRAYVLDKDASLLARQSQLADGGRGQSVARASSTAHNIIMASSLLALLALALLAGCGAFAPPAVASSRPFSRLSAAADDASANALSDYMAKSHEEKLRAVKDAEDKKNAEIEALKAEIQQLQSSSGLATTAAPAAPLANVATADLEQKLASYQSFMAEYIVNAQTQKLLAVKEAELKAEKKFQERLEKLFAAGGIPLPVEGGAAGGGAAEGSSLYQLRNAQVVAAAAAGKSRWGALEVEKAKELLGSAPAATVASTTASATASPFEQRNAQVVAAAAAGKSRWGNMEVEKAKGGAAVAVVETPAAPASVSLEDRVNLGARLLGV